MKTNTRGSTRLPANSLKILSVAATLALMAARSEASCVSDPYFVPGSWDVSIPSSGRFDALSNLNCAAVLDRNTGLVWEQSPASATFTWQGALDHCVTMLTGNVMGWRLPTVEELGSLVSFLGTSTGPGMWTSQYGLPSGHPFSGVSATFWSATSLASNASNAWAWQQPWTSTFISVLPAPVIPFSAMSAPGKPTLFRAWCVRGGRS